MQQFGAYIRSVRERRAAEGERLSLRRLAAETGIEPAYLSKIERGLVAPPSEETIGRLAEALGEDKDMLLALAGKVSSDLREIIMKRPRLFAELLRELRQAPDHAILRLAREVKDGDW